MSVQTATDWHRQRENLRPSTGVFVDGQSDAAASGAVFEAFSPVTGAAITEVARGDSTDVDRAVVSGRNAFDSGDWAFAPPAERRAALLRLADLIDQHTDELALLETMDMGKLVEQARAVDVPGAAATIRYYAEAIDKIGGEIAPTGRGDIALVSREPLGVIGAIVPWNFPLMIAAWKLGPALAAGNSVVLKPAEQSPLSALRIAELGIEAGLPAGVLNVVPGLGEEAGRALGLHPDVDALTFTGSTPVGKALQRYAGESNMKQVWLECGGKSPNLVFADADLEAAAEAAAYGIFYNQGQVCSANSRLLVERSVRDELRERIVEISAGLVPADPLDPESTLGAMVDQVHTERVMEHIERGRSAGRLIAGGDRMTINGSDCYITPTVFDDVDPASPLAQEEIFGPVLAIVAFDDEDEAVRVGNDSSYGLAASVWTRDLSRAHRVAQELRVGTVSVNTVDALSDVTPFGGFKQSGNARDLSLHALDEYTALKTTWIKL